MKYYNKQGTLIIQTFSQGISNVRHILANFQTFDFSTLPGNYDVIFIDGSHHYEDIVSDTKNVFKHLVHDKSIVVWHDYAYNPEKIRYEVMAAILEGTPKELHENLYYVSNTMCAIYSKESFPANKFQRYSNPKIDFNIIAQFH